jgi:hypothetical protein
MLYLTSRTHAVLAIASLLLLSSTPSALAHNVEVATDVAAIMHLEPDHNPKSGEPSRAWFVLTRQGGAQIPFEQCDCRLAVYAEPSKPGDAPILQPTLTPIAAEKYRDIPGATIVFPKSGQYTLALSGKPKGTEFQPFELRYSVTVTAGAAGSSPAPTQAVTPAAEAQPTTTPNSDWGHSLWLAGAGAIGMGIAGALLMKRQKK